MDMDLSQYEIVLNILNKNYMGWHEKLNRSNFLFVICLVAHGRRIIYNMHKSAYC